MERTTKILLTFLLHVGFLHLVGCSGSEHCYHVNGRYMCYFVPYGVSKTGEEWEKASAVCRSHGASLPIIENRTIQALVEKYMTVELPGVEMWAAGRGMRSRTWQWLNNHLLQNATVLDNHQYLSEIYDTQAIITNDLKMSGRYPGDKYHSVCQFSGTMCALGGSISFGGSGCLRTITSDALRWYEARNLCVDKGGDLPIFENLRLINRTREVFLQLHNATGIWIGLRKTWWLWKRTESTEEVKYTNWLDHDNYVNRECMLLTGNGKRWRQQYCMTAKRFFCQAVKSEIYSVEALRVEVNDAEADDYPHKMTIAVGVCIPLITVIAVASVLLATKCKMCSSGSREGQQPRRSNSNKGPGPSIAFNGGRYAEFRPLTRNLTGAQQMELQPRLTPTLSPSTTPSQQEQIWVARETVEA